METRSILQIVSGFKPAVDGMGDYARLLGVNLWQRHQIRSHFVVYRSPKTPLSPEEISPNSISYPSEASIGALYQTLSELIQQSHFDGILLHYGPYAYSPDGKPKAFARMIASLAQKHAIHIFFHELYAVGKPWKRAFWTNGIQRKSVGELVQAATGLFTSNDKYVHDLAVYNSRGLAVTRIPIFSNIGEPKSLPRLQQRSRQLIIFGQLPTRIKLYRDHRKTLEDVCLRLAIESIVDVGSGQSELIPSAIAGAPLRRMGFMEDSLLSALMADSIAGIVVYWPDVWEKSGVMAAYQAHALVPILVELNARRFPAPSSLPYLLPNELKSLAVSSEKRIPDEALQRIADEAYAHYMQNQTVDRCADVIAAIAI